MINSAAPPTVTEGEDQSVDTIVQSGPRGALAVAGLATAIVIALWFGFYFLVFLPRSA
jgi:cytochrome c oxidase subunit IIa family protein